MSEAGQEPSWRDGEIIDGRYKVIRLVGEGGMGWVYQVRHLQWGIDLAVKQPRTDRPLCPGAFEEEAEAWVKLGLHPNLCCCHYVRRIGGSPMAFAEYVPGGSLRQWISGERPSLYGGTAAEVRRRVLDVAIQFAWGLEHAHRRGMVHQDVKPDNVLLDTSDGDITVKVTDFGLARAGAGDGGESRSRGGDTGAAAGSLVTAVGGTKAYASPEQLPVVLQGRRVLLSQSTDVYSYAVSVLEMFTGKLLWWTGDQARQALREYRDRGAADPGMPPMPDGLPELLERCLDEKPKPEGRRPKSMAGIGAEIAAIYESAARSSYPRTMPRASDLLADELNNRGLSLRDLERTAAAGESFAAALEVDPRHLEATYNGGLHQWRSGAITDDVLIGRLEAARTASGDSDLSRYLLAEVHLERGDHAAADELLGTVARVGPEEPNVASARRTVRSGLLADDGRVEARTMSWHEYDGPGIPPIRIRLTADGRRALVVSGRHLGLWDVRSGQCLVRLSGEQAPYTYIDISADGRFALCGSGDEVWLCDLAGHRELWRSRTGATPHESINAVSLSADGSVAATVLSTAVVSNNRLNVMIWDGRTGRFLRRFGEHSGVTPVALSPDGRFVLTSGPDDGTARLWDTGTGGLLRKFHRDNPGPEMSISADSRMAAMAGAGHIGVWDLSTGGRIRTLAGHTRPVRALAWSGDGRFLLSAADDDTVRLWEVGSGRCLRHFPCRTISAFARPELLFAPEDDSPIVAEADTVRRWPIPTQYEAPPQLSRPRRHAELTRLDAEATTLIDAAEQAIAAHRYLEAHGLLIEARAIRGYERDPRALSAWRTLTDVLPRVGVRASWQVREFDTADHGPVVLSPDAACAAAGELYTLRVWDTGTGRCRRAIGHPSMVTAAWISPDQRRVASAAFCGQIGVWSVDDGECLKLITSRQNDRAHWTDFSADGRWALSNAYYCLRLWDLGSGECVRAIACEDGVSTVALAPDGRRALAGMRDHTLGVWDMETGECLRTLSGHTSRIGSVSFSPDGDLAVSCDDEKSIRLWHLPSESCVNVVHDLRDRIWSVRFVCGGRFVVTGSAKGAVQILDPYTGQCLHTFASGRSEVRIAPTPDGRFALTHGGDVPLRLWEFDWALGTSTT